MSRLATIGISALVCLHRPPGAAGFAPRPPQPSQQNRRPLSSSTTQSSKMQSSNSDDNSNSNSSNHRTNYNPDFYKPFLEKDFQLPESDVNPLFRLQVGSSEKVINAFGLWTLVVSLVTGPLWAAVMYLLNKAYEADTDNQYLNKWDPHRAIYDGTGKVWSKVWLAMTMSTPSLSGDVDRLKEGQGACLYVANHASWLDIPVLCTVLDPAFKFIAKGELAKVPCIGQQLHGGKHILINREDRKSQFLTFKEGLGWLKSGVPIMAFPEGQRSSDGRLIDFKGGIFSMAVKSKVPIVPISLSNTHAVMPGNSLFPVQTGAGKLHIHVHESIDTEGLSEAEIAEKVRETLLSKMPECQHPLPSNSVEEAEEAEVKVEIDTAKNADSTKVEVVAEKSSAHHHAPTSAHAKEITAKEITDAILKSKEGDHAEKNDSTSEGVKKAEVS